MALVQVKGTIISSIKYANEAKMEVGGAKPLFDFNETYFILMRDVLLSLIQSNF